MNKDALYLEMVKDILKKYPYTFYLFGSRVRGDVKKFSDFDICFFGPLSSGIKSHIEEDFDNSQLPVLVDLVDWNSCSNEFKKLIKDDLVLLQKGPDFQEAQKTLLEFK